MKMPTAHRAGIVPGFQQAQRPVECAGDTMKVQQSSAHAKVSVLDVGRGVVW
jgi:hypothetical protein